MKVKGYKSGCFAASQFISTGAIECVEGGGHYRPNRHAELARDIFVALERLLASPDASKELRLLSRKTHTKCAAHPTLVPSLPLCPLHCQFVHTCFQQMSCKSCT
jgi:hypothetical protein